MKSNSVLIIIREMQTKTTKKILYFTPIRIAKIKVSNHKGYRVSFGGNKNVLKFIIGIAAL